MKTQVVAEFVRDGARAGDREARPPGEERHPGGPRHRARHRAQVVAAPALQHADRLRLLHQAAGVVARAQHGLVRRHPERPHREQRAHVREQRVALRVRRHPPDRVQDRGIRRRRPQERNDRQLERRQGPHVDRQPSGRGNPPRDAQRGVERPVRVDLDDHLEAGPHHAPRNLGADRRGERALVDPRRDRFGLARHVLHVCLPAVDEEPRANRRDAGVRGPRRRREHPQQRRLPATSGTGNARDCTACTRYAAGASRSAQGTTRRVWTPSSQAAKPGSAGAHSPVPPARSRSSRPSDVSSAGSGPDIRGLPVSPSPRRLASPPSSGGSGPDRSLFSTRSSSRAGRAPSSGGSATGEARCRRAPGA